MQIHIADIEMKKTQMNLYPNYFLFIEKFMLFSRIFFVLKMFLIFVQRKKKNLYFTFLMVRLGVEKNLHASIHHQRIFNLGKGAKKIFLPPLPKLKIRR